MGNATPAGMDHQLSERGAEGTRIQTFVDAAFAFAVTLLIVSVDAMPRNYADLMEAFKAVPAFAFSFALISMFWLGHYRWSRRYGLQDGVSIGLSLLLVFLVLIFVFPLRMLAASAFHGLSGGYLPAGLALESPRQLFGLYVAYGLGLAAMSSVLALLFHHAWRKRELLTLSHQERVELCVDRMMQVLIAATGLCSALLALLLSLLLPASQSPWLLAAPGMVYNLLLLLPLIGTVYARRLSAG